MESVILTVNDDLPINQAICFNGDEKNGLDHETFYLERREYKDFSRSNTFSFCKTARKPYDLLVCAVLILIHTYAPESRYISSDGNADDWLAAYRWIESILEEGKYQLPISGSFTDEAEVDVHSWLNKQPELKQEKQKTLVKNQRAMDYLQSSEGSFYF